MCCMRGYSTQRSVFRFLRLADPSSAMQQVLVGFPTLPGPPSPSATLIDFCFSWHRAALLHSSVFFSSGQKLIEKKETCPKLLFLMPTFIYFKGRETETKIETEQAKREDSFISVSLPRYPQQLGLTRLKSGDQNSVQIFHVCSRDPSMCAITNCFLENTLNYSDLECCFPSILNTCLSDDF